MIKTTPGALAVPRDEPVTEMELKGDMDLKPIQCGVCKGTGAFEGAKCEACQGYGLAYLPCWLILYPKDTLHTPEKGAILTNLLRRRCVRRER